tara:strand:+ start:361 stop:654 length:294 start_codon:yes stop_codon:yes gene_type:complete
MDIKIKKTSDLELGVDPMDSLSCEYYYGYFSQKQFNNILSNNKNSKPYIYYYNYDNKIVQITEVSKNSNLKNFEDVINLGKVKEFHSVTSQPLLLKK